MNISSKPLSKLKFLILLSLIIAAQKAHGNINAIDFTKINYTKQLQQQVDFLRDNENLYNHWSNNWNYKVDKNKAIENLTFLYNELEKIPAKNIEKELLLGDIAHFIYNMDVDAYYQKAIDHYLQAKVLSPSDYRVYWFLGNHYALSANQVLSIQTYQAAMQYVPSPSANALFWANYALACSLANMPSTARYAAHQSSIISGKTTDIEQQTIRTTNHSLKSPPLDTAISAKDMWFVNGKHDNLLFCNNWLLGIKIAIDSTWKYQIGNYNNRFAYINLNPHTIITKKGRKIDYSITLLANAPKDNETLQEFLEKFTAKYKTRKAILFPFGKITNAIGYEMFDSSIYPEAGGAHMYAIVIERNQPEYPGMALEEPVGIPKTMEME